jgi:hypothetical protein
VVFAATSLTWPATDADTAGVQTRYQMTAAKPGSALPAYGTLSAPLTTRSVAVPVVKGGGSTCVRVVASQTSTSLTSSAVRCVSLPVDDRGLTRRGTWTLPRSSASFAGTVSLSRTLGATLTLRAARGSHLVIVATKLVRGGSIGVYVRNKRVAVISLATTGSAKYRQLIDLHLSGLAGVPVVLRVETSGKYVAIDGVAVRP